MKIRNFIFTFLFSIISIVCLSQNAWERITPTPQEHTINDLCKIPGTDKIMAVCDGTSYMTTTDLGQNWEIFNNVAGMTNDGDLIGNHFLNENVGFIGCSSTIIIKTTDAGETWQTTFKSDNKSYGIKSIDFVNENIGFAVGLFDDIFKTEDGGDSWFLDILDIGFYINDINFIDESKGFMVGNSPDSLFKTTNGGETWNLVAFPGGFNYGILTGIYFVNESVGFITAQENGTSLNFGRIYKTVDAGETWTDVYNDFWNMPGDIHFINENTGIVGCSRVMYESSALITHDAGESWNESIFTECSSWGANAVICNTENSYMIGGNMGFMYTNDGTGSGWELLHERVFTGDILYTQVFDGENIFAYSDEGLGGVLSYGFRKSNDGGMTWEYLSVTMTRAVFDFISPEIGFMVDNDYGYHRISKTINGGIDWTELATLPDCNYELIWCNFKDELNGIFSDGITIFITEDGGYSWNDISIPGPLLLDAEYIGENKIIMLANDWDWTYIYTSNDNGMTWNGPVNISWYYASGLYVNDLGTIYIPGFNSIMKSTDGGDSWIETTIIGSDIFFKSIHFPTEEIGYAVGYGSYKSIFKSSDGGNTWNELDINSTSTLNHVHFFDDEYGLVFGDNGLVMKTTTGGIVSADENLFIQQSDNFQVYPNPIRDEVFLLNEEKTFFEKGELSIYDQTGKLVYSNEISLISERIKIDCGFLNPGVYFLQINSGAGIIQTKKIIKF